MVLCLSCKHKAESKPQCSPAKVIHVTLVFLFIPKKLFSQLCKIIIQR
jgi:hypothetical protein